MAAWLGRPALLHAYGYTIATARKQLSNSLVGTFKHVLAASAGGNFRRKVGCIELGPFALCL